MDPVLNVTGSNGFAIPVLGIFVFELDINVFRESDGCDV